MKAPIPFPSGAVVAAISIIAANIFLPTFPSAAILPFQQVHKKLILHDNIDK